jgi:1-acyl-sn-glycerol-3-phosphate acyltransferase
LSYVDAPVLASLTACVPIAKGEIEGWPLLGSSTRSLGVVFVRRGDAYSGARALRAGLRALDAGVSVLGFPEGTTSRGDRILSFRRGLFGLARIAGVPVVPIAISYESEDLCWVGDTYFLPHYLRTVMRPETLVDVRIGRPVEPDAAGDAEALAEAVRSRIIQMIGRSRP